MLKIFIAVALAASLQGQVLNDAAAAFLGPIESTSMHRGITEQNQEARDDPPLSDGIQSGKVKLPGPHQDAMISTVGFPKLIFQHVIPGSKVVAKPITDRAQRVVVRIVDTYPHGSDFRYDIEYKGLEPGKYDVAEYLMREDNSAVQIPSINVEVQTLLPAGQVLPYQLPAVKSRFRSFYLPGLLLGGAAWIAGLLMILFYGRGKNKRPETQRKKLTVADRIRPLVDAAIAGELSEQEKAELERVLSGFWSKKLRLSHLSAHDLREQLRSHPEASVMLTQIDAWLHRPANDPANRVDVNEILQPYQSMNFEEV